MADEITNKEDNNLTPEPKKEEIVPVTEKKQEPVAKTFSQEDLDKILTDRLTRERQKLEKEITTKVQKEQAEQKLLEEQKWKELAEIREAELLELKKIQETVDREKKVNALLDKKEVQEPQFRKIFLAMNLELQELSDTVDSFTTIFQSAVEKAVSQRLGTNTPDKGNSKANGNKPISEMSDAEKVALIKEIGQEKYGKLVTTEFAPKAGAN